MTRAYVSLLSDLQYLEGVLTLGASLTQVKSRYPLLVLAPAHFIKSHPEAATRLSTYDIELLPYAGGFQLPAEVSNNINIPRWRGTFDKLRVFSLEQFEKVIFLDADMLVVRNLDHLFELENTSFARGADRVSGYEDWVLPNSGLIVVKPEPGLGEAIFATWRIVTKEKQTFGDQELIYNYYADYLSDTDRWLLPTRYNSFVFLLHQLGRERGANLRLSRPDDKTIAVLHYAGRNRPWQMTSSELMVYLAKRLARRKLLEVKSVLLYLNVLRKVRARS